LKKILYAASAVLLIVCACGESPAEQASATAVMPENPLMAVAVSDLSVVLANIDGYIGQGIPALGDNFLGSTLSAAMGVEDFDAMVSGWGLDPHGTAALFMEAMTPATMGFAVGASDPDLFFSSMGELGVEFTEGDPVNGVPVKSAAFPGGYFYLAGTRGLVLAAGSVSTLTSMLERLDAPASLELDPATFYYRMELGSIGPMAAAQLEMVRPQIMAEMAESGDPGDQMGMQMIGIYFDGISLFLTQTEAVEATMVIGPEDIYCESYIDFVPGSDLASVLCAPVEVVDLTGYIPQGDVIMARASIPPELTVAVVNAITGAMGIEYPQDALAQYAQWSRNTATTVMSDDAGTMFHMVAVYDLPEGTGLDQVYDVYLSQIDFTEDMLTEMGGMMDMALRQDVYMDRDFVVFDMHMNMEEMIPEGEEVPDMPVTEMDFTTWMTVSDGMLWIEMAEEPAVLSQLLDGTWTGPMAGDAAVFTEAPEAQVVMAFNLEAYIRLLTGFMGDQVDLSMIPSEPVWITGWAESIPEESRLIQYNTISGVDLAAMIGNFIPLFAGM
jgi:hypothetical protein